MPQPSRAQRRQARTGGSAPPPRRDPMRPVYIGAGIAVVILIVIFLIFNWQQNHSIQQAFATPTPGPNASQKPIQLADGVAVGAPHFKGAHTADTPEGGVGQVVDGIKCAGGMEEYATLHIHPHVALFVNGKQIQIPQYVGFAPSATGGCLYWIHTHDASGIVHIEAPALSPPQGGRYTLGMFFDIWGEPLTRQNVAGFKGPVVAYINGEEYNGELRDIPLLAHQEITLEVGTPVVLPPNYAFPAGD